MFLGFLVKGVLLISTFRTMSNTNQCVILDRLLWILLVLLLSYKYNFYCSTFYLHFHLSKEFFLATFSSAACAVICIQKGILTQEHILLLPRESWALMLAPDLINIVMISSLPIQQAKDRMCSPKSKEHQKPFYSQEYINKHKCCH